MWKSNNIPSNDTDIGTLKRALKSATARRYEDKWDNDVKDTEKHHVPQTYIKFKANFGISKI